MKRFIGALLLSGAMAALMLTGCSGGTQTEQDGADQAMQEQGGEEPLRVAIVQHMEHPSLNQINETIVAELGKMDAGIEIVQKNANGDVSLLPSIMQDLAGQNVDMIIPIATPTAQAAAAATREIPVVFSAVSNPVEAGLVSSFEDTSANITGVSNSIPIEDIFELAAEITPEAKTFGLVYNAGEINSATGIERAKKYCDENGLLYKEAIITSTADLQQAASSIAGEVDAFFTPNDNMVASAMATYLQVAMGESKPIYVGADSMVNDGGFATVGIDYTVLGKQTADMAVRILNGSAIADTPVEQIREYAKMVNAKTASELGIEIPEEIKSEFVMIGE